MVHSTVLDPGVTYSCVIEMTQTYKCIPWLHSPPPATSSSLLGLVLHSLDARPNSVLVAEVPSAQRAERTLLRDGLHVVIQLVHQGSAGGDVELGDDILADVVEVLNEGAEGVPVGGDDDGLVRLELGDDVLLEVGRHALEGRFEALRPVIGEVESGVPDEERRENEMKRPFMCLLTSLPRTWSLLSIRLLWRTQRN